MEYFEPRSLKEAVALLSKYGEEAVVIAGGTDVLVDMKYREVPACLVNIKKIPGLSYIQADGGSLRIGALTTIRELETDSRVKERLPVLWGAAHQFASLQIRNTATIGGNVCRASPAGETLAPLLILGAKAKVVLPDGEREVPMEALFLGPGVTVLGKQGLLKEVEIPFPAEGSGGVYLKHAVRGAMDIVMVGVAVMVTPDATATSAQDVRIGLAAVAPTPLRAVKAEAVLRGKAVEPRLIDEAAKEAGDEARPISDHRASAEYRRWIVEALTRRGLKSAWQATTGKGAIR